MKDRASGEEYSPRRFDSNQSFEKKKGKKRLLVVVAGIVLMLGAIAGTGYGIFHHYYSLMGRMDGLAGSAETENSAPSVTLAPNEQQLSLEQEEEPPVPPASEDEISRIEEELLRNLEQMEKDSELYQTEAFNILLVGVDSRSDSMSGRSDSMILVSINKKTKQVTMTSFLRDIYLSIPGHGNNRLNASYAFGGTELLTDTIMANFGISVDRCIVVNFYLVMDMVDAVNGIDLDVTADEIRVMNKYIRNHNQLLGNPEGTDILLEEDAGKIHVNGSQALAYARVRYVGTDFARTGRQRTVISKCLEKIKKLNAGKIIGLVGEFLPRIRTDLTEGDCATLLLMMLDLDSYEFQSLTVPVDGTWKNANINGMSVLTVDFSANARAWHDAVDGKDSE